MKIIKSNYNNFVKRVNENILKSPLADKIKNGKISYFEILNDDDSYIDNFEVFDDADNWLAIDVHDKKSTIDDEKIMKFILSELKNYYENIVLIISEEFKDKIKNAKKLGFKEICKEKQGNYNYIKLKKEL